MQLFGGKRRISFCAKQPTFHADYTKPAMIPVLIVLLLLTALVATEPSSPGGGDNG